MTNKWLNGKPYLFLSGIGNYAKVDSIAPTGAKIVHLELGTLNKNQ
jgi:hypothetical protein